ncbi:MAG: fumarylacetoacetase [Pirellulaceae bacterium]
MTYALNETHSPDLDCWVESANADNIDFPVQNLPFGVFATAENKNPRIGVAIGDMIVDLRACAENSVFPGEFTAALMQPNLNGVMAWTLAQRDEFRRLLSRELCDSNSKIADAQWESPALVPQSTARMLLPVSIGDYTDFYASVFHATNVGSMFRPDNPLLPNYKHIPIGYHGRASSIVVSGTKVRRPNGQLPPAADETSPSFGPCKNLDYELEVGALVSQGNELGTSISIVSAEEHLFGLCLLNDWSARDIQRWEYQPLGPFLAKSFASTISPWVVTMEALAPFRTKAMRRPDGDPTPLPYLQSEQNNHSGGVALTLEVYLQSSQMAQGNMEPMRLSSGSFESMYWTIAQMLTHHSSNGCNMRTGDLLGSGTVSGPSRSERGCLLELTWDGELGSPVPGTQRTPIELPSGEKRTFLADGDDLIIRGFCDADGYRRIGFGECRGQIEAAAS